VHTRHIAVQHFPNTSSVAFLSNVALPPAVNLRTASKTAITVKTQRPPNTLRVLVVEDEAMIAMLLAEVLRELGRTVCATEATEAGAVAAAARHQPDLMIVDDELRQGSGIAAVEQITRPGIIPHVFVTGDSLIGRLLSQGTVVIQKPFTIPELVWGIERALTVGDFRRADPQDS
jgi:CheY-like chemotaxis protein